MEVEFTKYNYIYTSDRTCVVVNRVMVGFTSLNEFIFSSTILAPLHKFAKIQYKHGWKNIEWAKFVIYLVMLNKALHI